MPCIDGISYSTINPTHCRYESYNEKGQKADKASNSENELTEEEQKAVQKLQVRDREVRAHEMAHVSAGGQYVQGGASFEYQTGPDGKRYTVGGEVSIDTSPVKGDPKATIQKMRTVRKAALAPAQPSSQDQSVAAKAAQEETKAMMDLREMQRTGTGEASIQNAGPADGKKTDRNLNASYSRSGSKSPAFSSASVHATVDVIA
jgi:hypothetical protein